MKTGFMMAATHAAALERCGRFGSAEVKWNKAESLAKKDVNREWAHARAHYCMLKWSAQLEKVPA